MKTFIKQQWEKLNKNTELKKIAININWLFLDKVIQMGVAFFVSIFVVRYLGPEQYGILSYVVAIISFYAILSRLGLEPIIIKRLVKNEICKEKILGTTFYLKMLGGFLAIFLSIITAYCLSNDMIMVAAISIASVSLIFQSTEVIDYWFQSRVISKHIVYSRSFAYIISASIKFFLIFIGASLLWFMVAIFVEAFIVSIGFTIAYFKNRGNIGRWIFDKKLSIVLLKESWPLLLAGFSTIIYMKIDQIMIGNILGYEQLGVYSVAVNLSEVWYFIPVIITASAFPALIKVRDIDRKKYFTRLQQSYDLVFWLAVGLAVFVTIFAQVIIYILYGQGFIEAVPVLSVYVWAGLLTSLNIVNNKFLVVENLNKIILSKTIFGAVSNIALNIYLIPKWGIVGASVATLISYFIMLFSVGLFKKTRNSVIMFGRVFNIYRIISIYKKY
jgi:O-antigen/teichoic acid export membrane protein